MDNTSAIMCLMHISGWLMDFFIWCCQTEYLTLIKLNLLNLLIKGKPLADSNGIYNNTRFIKVRYIIYAIKTGLRLQEEKLEKLIIKTSVSFVNAFVLLLRMIYQMQPSIRPKICYLPHGMCSCDQYHILIVCTTVN